MVDLILQLLVNGLIAGSLYALGGVSWGLIYNTTETFHYSACLIFSFAGYVAVLVGMDAQLPLVFSFVSAVVAAAFLGCLIEFGMYRNLRERGAKLFSIFLCSFGVATMGLSLILLIFSGNPRPLSGFPKIIFEIGPVNFTSEDILIVTVSWLLIGALIVYLDKSKHGKIIRAVSVNHEMAEISGLNVNRVFLLVYAIGSGLFGAAAFIHTLKYTATPFMGFNPFLMAFLAVFVGGEGSIIGAAIGGLIIGVVMQLGMVVLPGEFKNIVAFAVLFIVILIKPEGLLGVKRIL